MKEQREIVCIIGDKHYILTKRDNKWRREENKMDRQESELIRFYVIGTIAISLMLLSLLFAGYCFAEYNDHAIADAIYYAEGAEKASKPFGILSVKCEGYNECRRICLNTIRNNVKDTLIMDMRSLIHTLSF